MCIGSCLLCSGAGCWLMLDSWDLDSSTPTFHVQAKYASSDGTCQMRAYYLFYDQVMSRLRRGTDCP